jgi:thiamine kinase-like enzyme
MEQNLDSEKEIKLEGGRFTAGVVRIGDTVRRPCSPASSFIQVLLNHLEDVGFDGAPKYIGIDEKGRDTLSFLPGWVPAKFQEFTDYQIQAAGTLLKRFHDATFGSKLVKEGHVVCHHDPGPNNTVFKEGIPVAFIDFDFIAPGNPIEDIGYMAWTWCVSSKINRGTPGFQANQVRLIVDSYGLSSKERRPVFDSILQRQSQNIAFWTERLSGIPGLQTSREEIQSRINWLRQELAFTQANKKTFTEALR